MYARHTDKYGQRVKLPPRYDGSAFRHDTGERRPYPEMETKVHQPNSPMGNIPDVQEPMVPMPSPAEIAQEEIISLYDEKYDGEEQGQASCLPEEDTQKPREQDDSLLAGILDALDNEDWLLLFIVLLLLADGCQDWDILLLLGILLAVHS